MASLKLRQPDLGPVFILLPFPYPKELLLFHIPRQLWLYYHLQTWVEDLRPRENFLLLATHICGMAENMS